MILAPRPFLTSFVNPGLFFNSPWKSGHQTKKLNLASELPEIFLNITKVIDNFFLVAYRGKNRTCKSKQRTVPNHRPRKRRNRGHVVPYCHTWCLWIPERVPPDRAWVQLPRYNANCVSDMLSSERPISCTHVLEEVDQRAWYAIWVLTSTH